MASRIGASRSEYCNYRSVQTGLIEKFGDAQRSLGPRRLMSREAGRPVRLPAGLNVADARDRRAAAVAGGPGTPCLDDQ